MILCCFIAQEYDETVIDKSVVDSSVRYLLGTQKGTGKFDLIGRSHNHHLMVTNTSTSH